MAISYTGVLRKDLAEKLGGLSPQGMTRLTGNEGSSIELGVLAKLARWAASHGIRPAWLFAGEGEMTQAAGAESPAADAARDPAALYQSHGLLLETTGPAARGGTTRGKPRR